MEFSHPSPEITELHEEIHRDLSESTVIGTVYRLFSLLPKLGEIELPSEIQQQVSCLQGCITRHTWLVQESLATYLSLHTLYPYFPDMVRNAFDGMPDQYKSAFQVAELSFGSLDESVISPYTDYVIPMSMAVGLASLSPPISEIPSQVDLRNLDPFARFVAANSPNERYIRFLRDIDPPSRKGPFGAVVREATSRELAKADHRIHPEMEYHPIQQLVFDMLQNCSPETLFVRDRREERLWFRRLFAAIDEQLRKEGCDFFDRVEIAQVSEENASAAERLGAPFRHGTDNGESPVYDHAVAAYKYEAVHPRFLFALSDLQDEFNFRLHMFMLPHEAHGEKKANSVMLGCLIEGDDDLLTFASEEKLSLSPFGVILSKREWRRVLGLFKPGRLVLRTARLLYDDLAHMIPTTSHRVYIIEEQRSPNALKALLRTFGQATVVFIDLTEAKFIVVANPNGTVVHIAPATANSFVLFKDKCREVASASVVTTDDELRRKGIDSDELRSVLSVITGR